MALVTNPAPLFIDPREGSKRLLGYPALADAQSLALDADVVIVGNGPNDTAIMVGVEVKSIADLISSMETGRLQAVQLPRMLKAYDVNWLLCYGEYRPGRDGLLEVRKGAQWRRHRLGRRDVPFGYVESFLFDVANEGVLTKQVHDEPAAAAWLACLHRYWSKPWEKHKGMRVFNRSGQPSLMPDMDPDTKFRASIAKEFPAMGFERGLAAAKYFPSVQAMANAEISEWEQVPGIGKTIARAVVRAIRG